MQGTEPLSDFSHEKQIGKLCAALKEIKEQQVSNLTVTVMMVIDNNLMLTVTSVAIQ